MTLAMLDVFLSRKYFKVTVAAIITFAVTFAVWSRSLKNDFVDWDDLDMIVHNPRFEPPNWNNTGWYWTHPAWNLYQPMTTTLWQGLAYVGWQQKPDRFGGHLSPAVFHLGGVLLHTMNTALLYVIFLRLFNSQTPAVVGALIFGIHPIQTEPVVFIGAVNNPLAGFFSLLAILQYLSVTDPELPQLPGRKTFGWLLGSAALLLAVLAKPTAVVVPPIAFAIDCAFRRRPILKSIQLILPWVMVVLPCVIWTKNIQHGHELAAMPIGSRLRVAADAVNFYVHKIAWPTRLCIDYGRSPDFIFANGKGLLAFIAPVLLILLAIACAKRFAAIAAAIGIFLVGLLPNSGLLPFDSQLISTVADRYAYFAMIGVAISGAAAVKHLPRLFIPAVVLVICLIVRDQQQISTWANGESMFRQAIMVNPNSWMSEMNLASVIADRSPDEALMLCKQSIKLRDSSPDPWNTIGTIRFAKDDIAGSIDAFNQACKLAPLRPVFRSNLDRATDRLSAVRLQKTEKLGD